MRAEAGGGGAKKGTFYFMGRKSRMSAFSPPFPREHVHLLVYPGDAPERISDFLRAVKEPVARKAITYLKSNAPHWLARVTVREGPRIRRRFWQPGGGYDRNITSIEALRAMIDYIHANPVRAGLCGRPEQWPWSSARSWQARLEREAEASHL